MDVLVNWVTQIVLFLLFAAIIDLLIPANTMKKYIQFVVALVLILIFLKPVFFILNIDIQDAIETSFKRSIEGTESVENLKKSTEKKKGEIVSTQDAYILEEMAVQLKEIANGPLEKKYGVDIDNIDLIFKESEEYSFDNLEELIVYIDKIDDEEGVVDEIKDVQIKTDKSHSNENKVDQLKANEIKSTLQEVWELDDMKITLLEEGGAS